jgi:hypothetical protein
LPDKYRSVLVLCDLEGRIRKEAARQLRVAEGTVGGWLARARAMLAKRLAQRGVALPGGGLAAATPTSVVSSTMKAVERNRLVCSRSKRRSTGATPILDGDTLKAAWTTARELPAHRSLAALMWFSRKPEEKGDKTDKP